MNTILIPTDFSEASLNTTAIVLANSTGDMNIVFTHLFAIPDGIQDLFFGNYRKKESQFETEAFRRGCTKLQLGHKNLKSTKVEFFYGNTLAMFKQFLAYHNITAIAYSEKAGVKKISKSSIDALRIIKKCGYELINTDVLMEKSMSNPV